MRARPFPFSHPNGRRERLGILRVHERFAMSGTASVHFGWLVRSGQLVAVKRLHPDHVADPDAARARERARMALHLRHPNVVATLGVSKRPGEVLTAMEYIPGASLAEIADSVPIGLPPHVATAIAAGALRGLHAAQEWRLRESSHDALSHDITPASVIVGEDGVARVIDGGGGNDVPVPAERIALKLPYASPEQLLRRRGVDIEVDERRDVYAASVMLWETLTGRRLFRAPTVEGMLRKILWDEVPTPSRVAPWIRPELDDLVLRGLARDPDERFPSPQAMANELDRSSPCAAHVEVARALAAMDLACIRRRRVLADAVRRREGNSLHIECTAMASKA